MEALEMTVLNVIFSAMEMTARDVQTAATVINAKDANIVARKTAGAVQTAGVNFIPPPQPPPAK